MVLDKGFGGTPVGDLVYPTGVSRKVLDNKHVFYTFEQVNAVLSAITKEAYVAETHDCDDFALDAEKVVKDALPGVPFGFATGKMPSGNFHAVNVLYVQVPGGLQRKYYDATGRKWLTEFDVDFIMVW